MRGGASCAVGVLRRAGGFVLLLLIAVAGPACSSDDTDRGKLSGTSDSGAPDPKQLPPVTPSEVVPDDGSAGAKAINTRRCGSCHTEPGGPPLAGRITRLPNYPADVELYGPNLTPDHETGIGTWTDGEIRLGIREGVDDESLALCPQMSHYKTMSDEEVDAIIKYLRAMAPVKKAIARSICPPLKTK